MFAFLEFMVWVEKANPLLLNLIMSECSSCKFKIDGCIFLQNDIEVCEKKENGLVHLQNQCLQDIVKTYHFCRNSVF